MFYYFSDSEWLLWSSFARAKKDDSDDKQGNSNEYEYSQTSIDETFDG